MSTTQTLVLDAQQMSQKIQRMAWEIYEQNHAEKNIIVAGIAKRGFVLAKRIAKKLASISEIEVILMSVQLDKDNPLGNPIQLDGVDFTNQTVVLVDDVLKSGKTLDVWCTILYAKTIKKIDNSCTN